MPGAGSSDILIKFVVKGVPVRGESTTVLDVPGKPRNTLLTGFQPNGMFELETFSFSVGVDNEDGDDTKGSAKPPATGKGTAPSGRASNRSGRSERTTLGGYTAWRTGKAHKKYPVNVQPITFTRAIDRGSTALLNHCIACTSFDHVSLIKRRAAGSTAAGEAYLRMDFVGVLITEISWSNEDPIKETCKFISRAITVRYKPQLPNGTLGAPRVGFWSMLPWETEAPLR